MSTSQRGHTDSQAESSTEDLSQISGQELINGSASESFIRTERLGNEEAWSSHNINYINPFVHRLEINNRLEMAKIYMLTVLLIPIRVVGCFLCMISAWMFACVGIYGVDMERLKEKPFTGWRKYMRTVVAKTMRMVFAFGSFQYITFKGKRAPAKEAPILVIAPHSSYVDAIVVVACGPPSIVAKHDTSQIPLLGKIINFAQPIYVQREDPNSRQNTIREIVRRARSSDDWPQVVIFAEGTCTNRTALIKFKPGAFYPGVPVQPVLLKYPNKYDTFTWTWDGPGFWRLIWLTFAQFYNRCEIEYLPVYNPSDAEKLDANLYAKNVREVMAKALGVPTSEYSFEDVIMMSRAKDMKIPFPGDIVEIERTLAKLNLVENNMDTDLSERYFQLPRTQELDVKHFSEILQIDYKNKQLKKLFLLLNYHYNGTVHLKNYLICSLFCKLKNEEIIKFLRAITPIYAESSQRISRPIFSQIMRHAVKLSPDNIDTLFYAIDNTNKGFISFDDLQNYTQEKQQYEFLYKKPEQLRNSYETKKTTSTTNT